MDTLARDEVHVWCVALGAAQGEEARLLLSREERRRHDRLRRSRAGDTFAVARAALRLHLASYAGCQARDVVLAASEHGKPFVVGPPAALPLRFSVSHTDGLALIALCRGRELGVDVERIRPVREPEELGRAVFTERELQALRATPAAARAAAFFALWTRKEAVVKALGEGLPAMPSVALETAGAEERAVLASGPAGADVGAWRVRTLEVEPGYAAALAVAEEAGAVPRVSVRRSLVLAAGARAA